MATVRQSRRVVRRHAIANGEQARVVFHYPGPGGRLCELPLIDISISGLSFRYRDEIPRLETGAALSQVKVRFGYTDVVGQPSERTVRPLSLAYFGPVWVLAAWCELRLDFRTFRLDRMRDFAVTDERFRAEAGRTLHDFLKRSHTWTRSARRPDPEAA